MKAIKKLKDLFNLDVPDSAVIPVEDTPSRAVPTIQKGYLFLKDNVKKLLLWHDGIGSHVLILSGDTGCGKSSLIEQFCARLGTGLYRVPCHGRLEFQELIGGYKLMAEAREVEAQYNGKKAVPVLGKWDALLDAIRNLAGMGPRMVWVDGPVIRAMREGCVLMLDEFNFLHPTVFGGLNTILDGASFTITETGETVVPASGFRIALTGNGVDGGAGAVLYRGINKPNVAAVDRPCSIRCRYNSPTEDAQIILAEHPQMNPVIVDIMTQLAANTRTSFSQGKMVTVISTRKLVQWAELIEARPWKNDSPSDILDLLKKTLDFALLDARPPEEQAAVHTVLDSLMRSVPPASKKKTP